MVPFRIPLTLPAKLLTGGSIVMLATLISPTTQILAILAGIVFALIGLGMTVFAPNKERATNWAWLTLYFIGLVIVAIAR